MLIHWYNLINVREPCLCGAGVNPGPRHRSDVQLTQSAPLKGRHHNVKRAESARLQMISTQNISARKTNTDPLMISHKAINIFCKWAAVTHDPVHSLSTASGNVVKWKWSRCVSFFLIHLLFFTSEHPSIQKPSLCLIKTLCGIVL